MHHHFHHGRHCDHHKLADATYAQLSNSLLWRMRLVMKKFTDTLIRMNDQLPYHATPAVLLLLIDGDERLEKDQKELADTLHVTPATITGVIKRLKRDGLVRKKEDPNDLRRNIIELTDEGMTIVKRHRASIEHLESVALEGFSDDEQQLLIGCITRIENNLDSFIKERKR